MSEFECLNCGTWLIVTDHNARGCTCPECNTQYDIDYDAEFTNGMWHNLTKIHERNTRPILPAGS